RPRCGRARCLAGHPARPTDAVETVLSQRDRTRMGSEDAPRPGCGYKGRHGPFASLRLVVVIVFAVPAIERGGTDSAPCRRERGSAAQARTHESAPARQTKETAKCQDGEGA